MSDENREREQKRERQQSQKAGRIRNVIKEAYNQRDKAKSSARKQITSLYNATRTSNYNRVFSAVNNSSLGQGFKSVAEIGSKVGSAAKSVVSVVARSIGDGLKAIVQSRLSKITPVGLLGYALGKSLEVKGLNIDEQRKIDDLASKNAQRQLERKLRDARSEAGRSGGTDPRGPQFSSRDIRDSGSFPVAIDANRDGVLDLNRSGWIGAGDGLLALDGDGSGQIDQQTEIAFVDAHPEARTDLEGLALAFDSNGDRRFDAGDQRFGDFQLWQDANQDRLGQNSELTSLADAGITGIDLSTVPYEQTPVAIELPSGSAIFGAAEVQHEDGGTSLAGDVILRARIASAASKATENLARQSSRDAGSGRTVTARPSRTDSALFAA